MTRDGWQIETQTYGLAVRAATVIWGGDWPGKCAITPMAGGGWKVQKL